MKEIWGGREAGREVRDRVREGGRQSVIEREMSKVVLDIKLVTVCIGVVMYLA